MYQKYLDSPETFTEQGFLKVIQLAPGYIDVIGSLSEFLIKKGTFEKAEKWAQRAYKAKPSAFPYIFNLGHISLLIGNKNKSNELYRKALALNLSEKQKNTLFIQLRGKFQLLY